MSLFFACVQCTHPRVSAYNHLFYRTWAKRSAMEISIRLISTIDRKSRVCKRGRVRADEGGLRRGLWRICSSRNYACFNNIFFFDLSFCLYSLRSCFVFWGHSSRSVSRVWAQALVFALISFLLHPQLHNYNFPFACLASASTNVCETLILATLLFSLIWSCTKVTMKWRIQKYA